MHNFNGKMRFYCCLLIVSFVIETTLAAANKTSPLSSITQKHSSEVKASTKLNAESKNKRQTNPQFVRTPGTNEPTAFGSQRQDQDQDQPLEQSEALPLQLTQSIYGQQHGHSQSPQQQVFGRRTIVEQQRQAQVTEDVDENEPEPQQQQQHEQQSHLPSYYNYAPDIDDENDDTQQIDSRNLPVEPRNKLAQQHQLQLQQQQQQQQQQQSYPSTQSQRIHLTYTPLPSKQVTSGPGGQLTQTNPGQSLISEDEYLELIRNAELGKNTQFSSSKSPYSYATASPSPSPTPNENAYDYPTKSPFSNNDYKRFTSRAQTATTPEPHLQSQQSAQQQQYYRQGIQGSQYVQAQSQPQQTQYYTSAPAHDSYSANIDKDSYARINLKKYQQDTKLKYQDPSRGQYHHEVSVKPTKKFGSFKPSYQFAQPPSSTPSSASAESQPLHYQSVQHFAQQETPVQINPSQIPQTQSQPQPQRQYSLVVPQSAAQNVQPQAYYPQENPNPFRGDYYAQSERLTANNNYQSTYNTFEQLNAQSPSEVKPTSEIRVQFVHQGTPTPTPTPIPTRVKYVSDAQPLKYELFDPSGRPTIPKEKPPTIKLIGGPQQLHRPQYVDHHPYYMKKVKIQPNQHVHYVPQAHVVRLQHQHQQPTAQPTQTSPQTHSELNIPIQSSRTTYYAAQSANENTARAAPPNVEKQSSSSIPAGHQTYSSTGTGTNDLPQVRKPLPPLPITNPKKPISQAEFQALIDAGYKVQAIPVPVPVPVNSDKLRQLQRQQQQQQQQQQSHGSGHPQSIHAAHHHHHAIQSNRSPAAAQQSAAHYVRYHPQPAQESEEGILTSYLRPLVEYIAGPNKQ